jgi:hypothetical protein
MRRYVFSVFFLVAPILGLYFGPQAHAIPAAQEDCDSGVVSTTSNSFVLVPNTAVTVNNGTVSRLCTIQFSTEVFTSNNSATRLRYTINSTNPASCIAIGPGDNFFSLGTGCCGLTRTAIGTRTLGPGSQTIRPCFNAVDFGEPGVEQSTFGRRCLIVECQTQ